MGWLYISESKRKNAAAKRKPQKKIRKELFSKKIKESSELEKFDQK